MEQQQESLLVEALRYAEMGFPVFALSPFNKIPLKGTHGHKDATTDHETLYETFAAHPMANTGITLEETDCFVIDCDRHGDADGVRAFQELARGHTLPENSVAVTTPNNGVHFYFRKPAGVEIPHRIGFRDGLDILTVWVMAPGSRIRREDGTVGEYQLATGNLSDIPEAPQWLLRAIVDEKTAKRPLNLRHSSQGAERPKKYTAELLEKIVDGAEEGGRNDWVTSLTGTLFNLGMDGQKAYELLYVINESFIQPPLPGEELNTIFKSILQKESRKGASG